MPLEFKTWIRDPVHGSIQLTEIERQVIDTPPFQRLRRIKQLGLACLAFPSADYPRFEHSLGVLEVAGRILARIHRSFRNISDHEMQEFRLAALLHDIGHYPFSHAMDDAINEVGSLSMLTKTGQNEQAMSTETFLSHEKAGELVLRHSKELNKVLRTDGFDPDRLSRIFNHEDTAVRLVNLISSDLDADRLDYMARTALHTGLPYGLADINYLIEQIQIDNNDFLCFDRKALYSVEHMLFARYFDYQTLVRHRVVAGLERLLQIVLREMIRLKSISCSKDDIISKIITGDWNTFDDLSLFEQIRQFSLNQPVAQSEPLRSTIHSLLHRVPPKVVGQAEWLGQSQSDVLSAVEQVNAKLPELAQEVGIDLIYWNIWKPRSLKFFRRDESNGAEFDPSESPECVRILSESDSGVSKPIYRLPSSVFSCLNNSRPYTFRVYLTPPLVGVALTKNLRHRIQTKLRKLCPEINWV